MNFLKSFLPILCIVLIIQSCEKEILDCGRGEGLRETQTIAIDSIVGFDLNISASIFIKEGPTQTVEINSYPNIISKIVEDSEVNDQIWNIDFDRCITGLNRSDVEITITIPLLTTIKINGSGDVITLGTFENISNLNLTISGSGDMKLNLGTDINRINTNINGSGEIHISGQGTEQNIDISGSGDYNAFALMTNSCAIKIAGSGDCSVFATDELSIDISGSGDVCYRGTPLVDSNISGSGDITDCN